MSSSSRSYDVRREHLFEVHLRGGHRERVAVERADLVDVARDHAGHRLGGAADRAAREARPERFRERHEVRCDPERLDRSAARHREAGLHLVVAEHRTVGMTEILEPLQVSVVGQHHAAVRHDGLDDHAGDLAPPLGEHLPGELEVVERHADDRVGRAGDHAGRLWHGVRVLTWPGGALRREDAHHERVVVPVVRALDLHDQVTSGRGSHDAHDVERGLGAGVAEPPIGKPGSLGELFRDRQRVGGRLREVRAFGHPIAHGLDDLRVGVAHHHDAVAVVVVDVLVAVDVPDLRSLTAVDVDRVRRPRLPRRRHAARQMALRFLSVGQGTSVLVVEGGPLTLRELLDEVEVDLHDVGTGRVHRISSAVRGGTAHARPSVRWRTPRSSRRTVRRRPRCGRPRASRFPAWSRAT